jgi:hypothetical protein
MAKAKKSESKSAESSAAPRQKAAAGQRKKPQAAPAAGGPPMVDTTFAAQAAARMLAGRAKMGGAAAQQTAPGKESGAFKQMKQGLNKPAGQSAAHAVGNALGPNRSNLNVPDKGQAAHNQAVGNFARINVPRRTGG